MLFILGIIIGLCVTYDVWIGIWKQNKWYRFEKYALPLIYSVASCFIVFLIGWLMFGICPSDSKRVVKYETTFETADSIPVFIVHNNISSSLPLCEYKDKDKFCSFNTSNGETYYFSYTTPIEVIDSLPLSTVKFIQRKTYKKEHFPKNLDKWLFFFSLRDEDGWHSALDDYDSIILQTKNYKMQYKSTNETIISYDARRK